MTSSYLITLSSGVAAFTFWRAMRLTFLFIYLILFIIQF
ncbi:hypothetical protein BVRB_5g114480 [Beta vulgaris subsp. vulgaris]|nr:hypothetical protein BVRB_5g114480 [Beta vulgaris subsp. vulgaris]